jgi:DNA-binding protein YbaB
MVKAVVNGKKQLIRLEIDPTLIKPEDQAIMQDLIVAAVNKASEEAELIAREELRKSTEGLLPNIPGMDLGSMMG